MTIPYSRITRCVFSRQIGKSIAIFLAIFLVPVLLVLVLAASGQSGLSIEEALLIALILLVPVTPVFLLFYVVFDIGPRNTLVYRRADGRVMKVCFRIRPRALQRVFLERLEANRKAAERLRVTAESQVRQEAQA